MSDSIRAFFHTFACASLQPEQLGACFADSFLAADGTGARPVTRDDFLRALPRRAAAFADAGLGPTVLTALTETRLDDHYWLVRTEWSALRPAGGDPLPLASSFVLHDDGESLRIVLYLNHEGLP
ncbi:hypothetical protein BJ973_003076 [Actinoplanes tereljensis]|uniref:SnoaL-like domain-containing protein n=1 Tax=Paractinoplanes tereljensis TaxID=571912 RepID=A0A919TWC2_9ACTN|nr:hypothetical protein [Actinoplanes tereljensis]GIF25803.1 hypothetical protein Ate02nite_85330 [Actinoplanes tereljensis]